MDRYRMLPYLYTLLYRANQFGDTVTRGLFMNFPADSKTWDNDSQMMWGDGLLITPVITPDSSSVTGYFPNARWFDYYSGDEMPVGSNSMMAPYDHINLHTKGGVIIPGMFF